jgi:hypothetical protein
LTFRRFASKEASVLAGITIIGGPGPFSGVDVMAVPRVEIKRLWSDPWRTADDLEIVRLSWGTSQQIGELEVKRRYGPEVSQPYQSPIAAAPPLNLLDYWVRVRLYFTQIVWIGRVLAEARDVQASSTTPSGRQTWVASEPLRLLQRMNIGNSVWPPIAPLLKNTRIGWVPSFNSEDDRFLAGNRSVAATNGTYTFGGRELWSRFDMATYLLERFADETIEDPDTTDPVYDPVGPLWVLAGQAVLLQGAKDLVDMEVGDSVATVLGRIISPDIGVDYRIAYLPGDADGVGEGFEVAVFSLAAKQTAFGGVSFPFNGQEIRIAADTQDSNVVTKIIRSNDQRYKRIRIVGRRVVACCSLSAADGSLVKKWPQVLQDEYLGLDLEDGVANDKARLADRFNPVFQFFGAPADWEFNDFLAFPALDNEGNFFTTETPADPQYQNTVRRTLSWLPFREGFDYTTDPPLDRNDPGASGEFIGPQAWLKDEEGHYLACDQIGFALRAMQQEWGLVVNGSPNHLLAVGHFGAAVSEKQPLYSYDDLVMTMAFETDHRLELVYEEPHWRPSDGELVIDTDAELWFAAPDTVLGVNNEGQFLRTPTTHQLTLRNDAARMYLIMAGAIARYASSRARADVEIVGLQAAGGLIGRILTVVEAGVSDAIDINAPITAVEWMMGREPRTIIRAGFAR